MTTNEIDDPFAPIREACTDSANYELTTEDIIDRLTEWQSLCSFRVNSAGHDTVDIEFETLPADMDAFVRDLYEFCPDLVDQGTGYIPEILKAKEKRGEKPSIEFNTLVEGVNFSDENYGLEILKRELQLKKAVKLWWD